MMAPPARQSKQMLMGIIQHICDMQYMRQFASEQLLTEILLFDVHANMLLANNEMDKARGELLYTSYKKLNQETVDNLQEYFIDRQQRQIGKFIPLYKGEKLIGEALLLQSLEVYEKNISLFEKASRLVNELFSFFIKYYIDSMKKEEQQKEQMKEIDKLLNKALNREMLFKEIFKKIFQEEDAIHSVEGIISLIGILFTIDRIIVAEETLGNRKLTFDWIHPYQEEKNSMQKLQLIDLPREYFSQHILINSNQIIHPINQFLHTQCDYKYLQIPIIQKKEKIGFIGFCVYEVDKYWSVEEVEILQEMGMMLAGAIFKKRKYDQYDETKCILNTITENINEWIYVVNKDTYEILYVNKKIISLFPNAKIGDVCYKTFYPKQITPCKDCPIANTAMNRKQGIEIYNHTLRKWLARQSTKLTWINYEEVYMISLHDITEIKKQQAKIFKIAYYDRMLNIPNRDMFLKDLEEAMQKDSIRIGGLLLIDISNFRGINQTFGKQVGDALLTEIVDYFNIQLKAMQAYRLESDVFGIIVHNRDSCFIKQLCEKIFMRFTYPWIINQYKLSCMMNMGVTFYNRDIRISVDEWINHTYLALEEAKESTETNIVYFNDHIGDKIKRRCLVENTMRECFKNRQIYVVYQPIFDIEKKSFTKMEALVRLHTTKIGVISPSEFIPIAENNGMIIGIGTSVLERVCGMLNTLQKQHIVIESVAVNFSSVELMQLNFVDRVTQVINEYHINPKKLVFEITERVLIHSFEYVKQVMQVLAKKGISFAIDDFGTGYSGLNYLAKLPIQYIKLDKTFIDMIEQEEQTIRVIRHIISMAHELGIKVIAEGVETQRQSDLLKQMECDYIQGYFYAKPLKDQEITTLLESNKENIYHFV